jgi:hypothetical protein
VFKTKSWLHRITVQSIAAPEDSIQAVEVCEQNVVSLFRCCFHDGVWFRCWAGGARVRQKTATASPQCTPFTRILQRRKSKVRNICLLLLCVVCCCCLLSVVVVFHMFFLNSCGCSQTLNYVDRKLKSFDPDLFDLDWTRRQVREAIASPASTYIGKSMTMPMNMFPNNKTIFDRKKEEKQ